jgi:hypothetical protein
MRRLPRVVTVQAPRWHSVFTNEGKTLVRHHGEGCATRRFCPGLDYSGVQAALRVSAVCGL